MIDCCELALANAQLAKHIAWGAFALIALLFVVVFGYNLKWRKQQIELSQRTNQLEKKNGKELREIAQLRKEIAELKDRQKDYDHDK